MIGEYTNCGVTEAWPEFNVRVAAIGNAEVKLKSAFLQRSDEVGVSATTCTSSSLHVGASDEGGEGGVVPILVSVLVVVVVVVPSKVEV